MVKKKAEKQKKKAVVVSIDVTESKRKPVALHKAFLDALGKKYIEKKDKGFYTISDEKDKKSRICARCEQHLLVCCESTLRRL
jgi:hypothetical protein